MSPHEFDAGVMNRDFDIIVIGGGHAGVEAALAGSRRGHRVAIVTMDPAKLALMSCNPAIGGIGKSQLVKEIDALGGIMGMASDATGIQFRRLNLSRGPAVWSTRVQTDRVAYNEYVVDFIEADPNIEVVAGLAGAITSEQGAVTGILMEDGESIGSKAVVVASGTFLGGLIHIGDKKIRAGRLGEQAAYRLSDSFRELGFEIGRLKTGTPPRINGKSVDWSVCERQPGETPIPFFSWRTRRDEFEQTPCYLSRTTEATKEIISNNFEQSPIFSGQINSTGPRYCPSIEDKFFRFADKASHQIFLEPEGNGTDEVYPNGFSTALPEDVQREAIRTVVGLEEAEITRPGYAVEYDYCPASQIEGSLQTRRLKGLYFAGQINGTSGYEEAAAQGLMAGLNASLQIDKQPALILDRSQAYIGVMIDDLTIRSTTEPYRMFTSRAEYRLALREDNARDRLFDLARETGLVSNDEHGQFDRLRQETEDSIKWFSNSRMVTAELPPHLGDRLRKHYKVSLADLLRQPGITLGDLRETVEGLLPDTGVSNEALERAAIQVRYHGYIEKQQREIDKFRRQEQIEVPQDFDYRNIHGLKSEAREKLLRFRPSSLGQAGRIEGVTAGDLAVLSVSLKRHWMAAEA